MIFSSTLEYYLSNKITIVAADDHAIFLQGLESLLSLQDSYNLCGFANNGDELLALIHDFKPDIALVDLSMPGASTEEIIKTTEINSPGTQLIALTMHLEAYKAKKLLELGLSGYVLKESAFEELATAIDKVHSGDHFLSPAMVKSLREYDKQYQEEKELTNREKEVLENAASGQSNKEIARTMDISERTVRFHVSNCCLKLNANGRANAVAIALKHAFITY